MAKSKISVRVMWVKCKEGQTANLQIYYKGVRSRTSLGLVLLDHPKTPLERTNNTKVKQIATEKANAKYLELIKGESTLKEDNTLTFYGLIDAYIAKCKTDGTKKTYKTVISTFKKIGIKDIPLSSLSKRDIDNIIEKVKNMSIKANSKREYLNKFLSVLRWGYKTDKCKNLNKNVEINIKADKTLPYTLTKEEVKSMYEDALMNIDEKKTAFLFSCFTGLRYSDIEKLLWSEVADGHIKTTMQKTNKPIFVPLCEYAQNLLGIQDATNKGVFNYLPLTTLDTFLKKWYCKLFGTENKKIHFHTARHTFCTMNLESGVDIVTIKELAGHTNINTTLIYTEITNQRKTDAIKKMNDFLK